MLNNIQVLRGIAALLVVWVHTQVLITANFIPATLRLAGFGGVDLFFVISGFIIVHSTAKGMPWLTFAKRRFFRIAPLYYIFTGLVILICIFLPSVFNSTQLNFATIAKSLLFVPFEKSLNHLYPIYSLGWTLNYEMFFYFLFTLALIAFNDARTRVAVLVAVMVGLTFVGMFIEQPGSWGVVTFFYTRPIILEFVFGMVIAATRDRLQTQTRVSYYVLLSVGLIGFLLSGLIFPTMELAVLPETNTVLRYGVPAAMIVLGAVGLEQCHQRVGNSVLRLIGDASYSIYLSHFLVVAVLGLAVARIAHTGWATLLCGLVVMAIATIFGVITYRCVEQPLTDSTRLPASGRKPLVPG
ncbi:acyltransferase [Bradyrhizobium sp. BR 10289]|uniref:acyltransferase family protein n=1 Tax=Bradyrhizobium sp. BR 10289 TaxID=2749993 RepID=UPI001C648A49|nr:acyltransferase [Bradyrhizobium sp. BR 10289]